MQPFTHTRWTAVRRLIDCKREDAFYSLVFTMRCYFGQWLEDQKDIDVLRVFDTLHEHIIRDLQSKKSKDLLKKTLAMYSEVLFCVGPTGNINADIPEHRKNQWVAGILAEEPEQKAGTPVYHASQNWSEVKVNGLSSSSQGRPNKKLRRGA